MPSASKAIPPSLYIRAVPHIALSTIEIIFCSDFSNPLPKKSIRKYPINSEPITPINCFELKNNENIAAKPYARANRCSTPANRKESKCVAAFRKLCPAPKCQLNCPNQFKINPMRKITNVRFTIFQTLTFDAWKLYLRSDKNVDIPMINIKKGNAKSVGVNPCQSACFNG